MHIQSTAGTRLTDDQQNRALDAAYAVLGDITPESAHTAFMALLDADDQEAIASCLWVRAEDAAIHAACTGWARMPEDLELAV